MFVALALSAVLAAQPPAQRLAEARRLVDDLQYEKALKAVDAALAQGDIDHETLVGLYELAGIAYATLDKTAKAKESFQQLLSIAPEYQLSKNLPPRTRTPFFEAKTWLGNVSPVSASVEPVRAGGVVTELVIVVKDNALVAARSTRVTLSVPGKAVETLALKLEGKRASTPVGAPTVAWKVEVLGDKGVLHVASGEAKPVEVISPPPPPPVVTAAGGTWKRTTGIVLGAAGLAALVGGGVFGWLSADARARISSAERDMNGTVTGITQVQAAQLDAAARSNATIANALFIAGGVLAASGLGLIIFGGGDAQAEPAVSLLLSPAGATLSGRF